MMRCHDAQTGISRLVGVRMEDVHNVYLIYCVFYPSKLLIVFNESISSQDAEHLQKKAIRLKTQ